MFRNLPRAIAISGVALVVLGMFVLVGLGFSSYFVSEDTTYQLRSLAQANKALVEGYGKLYTQLQKTGVTPNAPPVSTLDKLPVNGTNGQPGGQGPQGPPGPQGPQGIAGLTPPCLLNDITRCVGPQGAVGQPGQAGTAGAMGAAGVAGAMGTAGAAGATGAAGAPGVSVTGPAGPAGPPGADGAVGPTGPAGATGSTGAVGQSAFPFTFTFSFGPSTYTCRVTSSAATACTSSKP